MPQLISASDLMKKIQIIQNMIDEETKIQINNKPKEIDQQPNSKHKCVICKQYLYTELIQTRSGDEASTLFCYCCNKKCIKYATKTTVYTD